MRVIRALRLLPVALLAVVCVGCSSSDDSAPARTPAPQAASNAASTAPAPDPGFPTAEDGPVLDAAKTFVETVTTYDHTKLADHLNAALPLTADPLQNQLRSSLSDTGEFATTTRSNARDAKGRVLELGLVSRAGGRATVIVFVDQQITSPDANDTQRLRERVTLVQSKGSWLAIKLETL